MPLIGGNSILLLALSKIALFTEANYLKKLPALITQVHTDKNLGEQMPGKK